MDADEAGGTTIIAGQTPSFGRRGYSPCKRPVPSSAGPDEENHRLESRMREIRQSGSEGGGGGDNPPLPTPMCAEESAWSVR